MIHELQKLIQIEPESNSFSLIASSNIHSIEHFQNEIIN
jgi:hypothetical protein